MGRQTFVVGTRHEKFSPNLKICERNLYDKLITGAWVDLEFRKKGVGSWLSTLCGPSKTFLSLITICIIKKQTSGTGSAKYH